jgi:NADH-quinone oxidoreductase subunit L
MGGLRKQLPIAFWTFLIGGCSLAGLPLVTAGFYSKDLIVWQTWASGQGSIGLWIAAIAGVLLTAFYTFRLIFLVFFGEANQRVSQRPGYKMKIPVIVLAFLSIVGGFDERSFTSLMHTALPDVTQLSTAPITETLSAGIAATVFLIGLVLAWFFFLRKRGYAEALAATAFGKAVHQFWLSDWGFDWLYDRLFVRPLLWFARLDKHDFIDSFYTGVARLSEVSYRALSLTQTGRVRWYAAGIAAGAVVLIAMVLFL